MCLSTCNVSIRMGFMKNDSLYSLALPRVVIAGVPASHPHDQKTESLIFFHFLCAMFPCMCLSKIGIWTFYISVLQCTAFPLETEKTLTSAARNP